MRPEVEVEVGGEERAQEQQGQQAVPAQPGHGPSGHPGNTWGADGRSSWSTDEAGMLTQGISSSWLGVFPELGDSVQEAHSVDSVVFSCPVETRGWGSLATRLLFESLCLVTPPPGTAQVERSRGTSAGSGGRVGAITGRSAKELSPPRRGLERLRSPGRLFQGCCRSAAAETAPAAPPAGGRNSCAPGWQERREWRVDEAGAPWGELVFAPRLLEAEVTPSLPAAWLGLVPAPPPTLSWHLPLA